MPLIFEPFWKSLAYLLIKEIIVGTAITMLFILTLYALLLRLSAQPATAFAVTWLRDQVLPGT